MKKWLPCLALIFLVFVTASCQKPEEVIISKYFNALKMKDNLTLRAMALQPVFVEFESWKVKDAADSVTQEYRLPGLTNELNEMKKKREAQFGLVKDKKIEVDSLKGEESEARGRKKIELQQKLKVTEEALKTESDKFNQMQRTYGEKRAEIDNERSLVRLSTGFEKLRLKNETDIDISQLAGKTLVSDVVVAITTKSGVKDYIFTMFKYDLVNPDTNKVVPGKFVIQKISTKEETAQ